ncbi:MAG: ATP-binding protein [Firmicutes bacterium]|nr:ATP-binding protein [Bacillota bacterium]
MEVKLRNIGIIKDSTIKLSGLTIVTGHNNSGKSTVGKAIYSLVAAVDNLQDCNLEDKSSFALQFLRKITNNFDFFRFYSRRQNLEQNQEKTKISEIMYSNKIEFLSIKELLEYVNDFSLEIQNLSEDFFMQFLDREEKFLSSRIMKEHISEIITKKPDILESIKILIKDLESDQNLTKYANARIERTLKRAFSGQIQPVKISNPSSLLKVSKGKKILYEVSISENKVNDKESYFSPAFFSAILIDDVHILDSLSSNYELFNRQNSRTRHFTGARQLDFAEHISCQSSAYCLLEKLSKPRTNIFEDIVNAEKAKQVVSLIKSSFSDEISYKDGKLMAGENLDLKNLATGSKLFAILKMLLEKGHLDSGAVLILDEPEAHLHPEWQNTLAEIVVLLQKQLGLTILLTTHSPNFLLALQTMCKKHEIYHATSVYSAEKLSDNYLVKLEDITNNVEVAFSKLVRPYLLMEETLYALEEGAEDKGE